MMEATIIMPLRFNDGRDIPDGPFDDIDRLLLAAVGAYSRQDVFGRWQEHAGQPVYSDYSFAYTVTCEDTKQNRGAIRAIAETVRVVCKQKSVYVHIIRDVEVEFVS